MAEPLISVTIVTHDSAADIERCLDAIAVQSLRPDEVVVVDNASADDSVERARRHLLAPVLRINERNLGFTGGQNLAIGLTTGRWILVLNPDVVLAPDFLEQVMAAVEGRERLGAVTGKLLRLPARLPTGVVLDWPPDAWHGGILDSTGIRVTPSCRHLDRGAGEEDRGQYERPEPVFGASGAAALYRRQMLEEAAGPDGQIFDEDFFCFREDADLAWRCQLLGWDALYWPGARALHRRRVTPERRRALPPEINMHSVKNRFLLRIKNQTFSHFLRFLVPTLWRDLLVIGAVMITERTSLPALGYVWRHRKRFRDKRRSILARRTRPDREVNDWFRYHRRGSN